MTLLKTVAKRGLKAALGSERTLKLVNHYGDSKTLMRCWVSPAYWVNVKRLQSFRDRHKGQRCFIIGNGPSLKKMDLTPLKDEITFGLNRIYILFAALGFATTYFVSVNRYVIEQCADEITQLPCQKFISWTARRFLPLASDLAFIRSRQSPGFYVDVARQGVWEGATVTYVAMQIACYMGFQRVILIGVDHSFQTEGEPHQLITSEGDDPNHFHPEYFGKGFRWQLPDLETSELAYRLAKRQFELTGREILDATVGGKLQVFPKVDYTEIVSEA